jgi:hypothetical protein
MLAEWFLAIVSPFLTTPMPVQEAAPVEPIRIDAIWFRPDCLQVECGDEEWQRQLKPLPMSSKRRPRLPGLRAARPLSAPARPRESRAAYVNDWRVGTRYGMQLVRDGDTRLGVEFGAGYRFAPLHDDGISLPGPVFRGGISIGQRLGERAQWSQRVQFETGNGERFVKQMLGIDVELPDDWELETDYVIRYDSQGASGTDTAEAWLGLRRRF